MSSLYGVLALHLTSLPGRGQCVPSIAAWDCCINVSRQQFMSARLCVVRRHTNCQNDRKMTSVTLAQSSRYHMGLHLNTQFDFLCKSQMPVCWCSALLHMKSSMLPIPVQGTNCLVTLQPPQAGHSAYCSTSKEGSKVQPVQPVEHRVVIKACPEHTRQTCFT